MDGGFPLARTLHHLVSTSLQQGLCLYKLKHMAMSPSLSSYMSQHPACIASGLPAPPHARSMSLVKAGQRGWETDLVIQAEAGTHHWRALMGQLEVATTCHSWLFAGPWCRFWAGLHSGGSSQGGPGFDVKCRKIFLSWKNEELASVHAFDLALVWWLLWQ